MEIQNIDKLLKFAEQQQRKKEYNKNYSKMRYLQLKENEDAYKEYLNSIKSLNNERSKTNFLKIKKTMKRMKIIKRSKTNADALTAHNKRQKTSHYNMSCNMLKYIIY